MHSFSSILEHCELCPRRCGVNRLKGGRGFCGAGSDVVVAHYGPHFGEEPPISGLRGSGNIFFSPCNLRCVFCQNYQISQTTFGQRLSVEELADVFFHLERTGVHTINLVSPTPYVPIIAAAVRLAKTRGIKVPFVYNTNAYENVETLRILRGLVDVYLPDFKYWHSRIAAKLSSAPDYPQCARESIAEMKAQVGDLSTVAGIARRGLLIRHLVLPGALAGTRQIVRWIKASLGTGTFVSLMSQYYPVYRAAQYRLLDRKIRRDEYDGLVAFIKEEGFENAFVQEPDAADLFLPDFGRAEPFEKNRGHREGLWN